MGWRTIIFKNRCKLDLLQNHIVIYNEKGVNKIFIDEIDAIILESNCISITVALLTELTKKKINIVFCDEKHNPLAQINMLYGSYNCNKNITNQFNWTINRKNYVFQNIIKHKLINQNKNLKYFDGEYDENILNLIKNIDLDNYLHSEAVGARIYFAKLYGDNFHRHYDDLLNSQLNYGYSVLLSIFNREIISMGYLTQIGINHKNQFNYYNLSCDLIEPFRYIIDAIIKKRKFKEFNSDGLRVM